MHRLRMQSANQTGSSAQRPACSEPMTMNQHRTESHILETEKKSRCCLAMFINNDMTHTQNQIMLNEHTSMSAPGTWWNLHRICSEMECREKYEHESQPVVVESIPISLGPWCSRSEADGDENSDDDDDDESGPRYRRRRCVVLLNI